MDFAPIDRVYRDCVNENVPNVTVQRLPVYLSCLESLGTERERVSSEELATLAGVTPAKIRKDLSYLGTFGVRGVGYDIEHLRFQIRVVLGLEEEWPVVIVGVGNLGRALANYGGFQEHGFDVVGLFDADPAKVGTEYDGMLIRSLDELGPTIHESGATIGIITTPASAAQATAQALADAGIKSILNFAPVVIKPPGDVDIRRVDLSTELQVLSFYLHRRGVDVE